MAPPPIMDEGPAIVTEAPVLAGFGPEPHPSVPARRPFVVGERLARDLAAATATALAVATLGHAGIPTLRMFALAFVLSLAGSAVANRRLVAAALLPLMRSLFDIVGPVVGLFAMFFLLMLTGQPPIGPVAAAAAAVAAYAGGMLIRLFYNRLEPRRTRVLVAGSPLTAARARRELMSHRQSRFEVVGWVGSALAPRGSAGLPRLGNMGSMRKIAQRHSIDLVVVSPELKLSPMLDELATTCADLSLRVVDSTTFYERAFGHIPLTSLGPAWFHFVFDPNVRRPSQGAKRALDLCLVLPVALIVAPLAAMLALAVRLDGGPALFRQVRIGEGGRSFTLYKLRSMRAALEGDSAWCAANDARVTRVGRFLRRTHLDELPQLLNVLRGDMSLVGPRPEQPHLVEQLEESLPYYYKRHMIRPGVTGWAQVRCGYSGSVEGSSWKLSHDLYYLKHRSVALDLLIISETLRTLVADRQYGLEPAVVAEIVSGEITGTSPSAHGI